MSPLSADQTQHADRKALRLMLDYMQQECSALGHAEAAEHIAQARRLLEPLRQALAAGPEAEWARLLESPLGHA